MEFTLWLGLLPLRWVARIEQVTQPGFVDREVRGPVTTWVHRQPFVTLDAIRAEVVAGVGATLGRHLRWKIVGLGMWLNMPTPLAYRQWRTRRIRARSRVRDA